MNKQLSLKLAKIHTLSKEELQKIYNLSTDLSKEDMIKRAIDKELSLANKSQKDDLQALQDRANRILKRADEIDTMLLSQTTPEQRQAFIKFADDQFGIGDTLTSTFERIHEITQN